MQAAIASPYEDLMLSFFFQWDFFLHTSGSEILGSWLRWSASVLKWYILFLTTSCNYHGRVSLLSYCLQFWPPSLCIYAIPDCVRIAVTVAHMAVHFNANNFIVIHKTAWIHSAPAYLSRMNFTQIKQLYVDVFVSYQFDVSGSSWNINTSYEVWGLWRRLLLWYLDCSPAQLPLS